MTYVKQHSQLDAFDLTQFLQPFMAMHVPAIYEYTSANKHIHECILSLFHNKEVVDINALKHAFVVLDAYITYSTWNNVPTDDTERALVKSYISMHYHIHDNTQCKASDLVDQLLCHARITVANTDKSAFRNRLSGYLKEMNIPKKRFRDGVYYGLKLRETVDITSGLCASFP